MALRATPDNEKGKHLTRVMRARKMAISKRTWPFYPLVESPR